MSNLSSLNPTPRVIDVYGTHSITSSARASSVGGTSNPSALAVLRLSTSSYLVGPYTGRSPGLSPLRMRSSGLLASIFYQFLCLKLPVQGLLVLGTLVLV